MAAFLENEQELRQSIHDGKYYVDEIILQLLDRVLSDYLFAMMISVKNYIEEDQAMPFEEAKRMLTFCRGMNAAFRKIMHPDMIMENDHEDFKRLRDQKPTMDKDIRIWIRHHIGNDSQSINFIIGDFIDDQTPIPVKFLEKRILPRIKGIEDVLNVLLKKN